jgi:hypothetical protein
MGGTKTFCSYATGEPAPELLVPLAGHGAYCAVRIGFAIRNFLGTGDAFAVRDVLLVVRFTRHWIHYGFLAHTVVCVLIAALEGLLGR